ncbi:hypothetical protein HYDPIDRAFT_168177 [Hydnomerulius pinastri MD-312]|uniref:Uncharacterized protein n=1 Tax=Hydnomerulius pinastri MD-312 TaxID=994086 RepID=A0A0C9W8Z8_9AGAM|nr:hypothetical protein HYDPIDRAFT_168177 [Hydnomerulius pinastri MD-312]
MARTVTRKESTKTKKSRRRPKRANPVKFPKPARGSGLTASGLPASSQLALTSELPVPPQLQTMSHFAASVGPEIDDLLAHTPWPPISNNPSFVDPDHADGGISGVGGMPMSNDDSYLTYHPMLLHQGFASAPNPAGDSLTYNHLAIYPPNPAQEIALLQPRQSIFADAPSAPPEITELGAPQVPAYPNLRWVPHWAILRNGNKMGDSEHRSNSDSTARERSKPRFTPYPTPATHTSMLVQDLENSPEASPRRGEASSIKLMDSLNMGNG